MQTLITHNMALDILCSHSIGYIRPIIEDFTSAQLQHMLEDFGIRVYVMPQVRDLVRK